MISNFPTNYYNLLISIFLIQSYLNLINEELILDKLK